MLGKLIKYEFMAEYKKYSVIYIAMVITSFSFLIVDRGLKQLTSNSFYDMLCTVVLSLFILLCMVALVMVIVCSCKRFWTNLYGDEGYLMHTLPVPAWNHIVTKILCGTAWSIVTLAVIALSISVMTGGFSWINEVGHYYISIKNSFIQVGPEVFWNRYVAFVAINVIIFVPELLIYIFFCIAVGSLFNVHRKLMATVTYILVTLLSQLLGIAIMAMCGWSENISFDIPAENENAIRIFSLISVITIALSLIEYTVMYIATNHIMKKKLNLE